MIINDKIIKSMSYINGDPEILPYSKINFQIKGRPDQAMGQIKISSPFGKKINELAKDKRYKNFLEIGSCCGLGTTKCLLDSIILREDESNLTSYESNFAYYSITNNYWNKFFEIFNIPSYKLNLIYGSIISYNELDSNYVTDSGHTKETYDYNLDIKKAPIIPMDTPVDVLCLDGGHFSTICEWNKFKKKIKVIILDDTKTSKTNDILREIESSNKKWKIIYKSEQRSGEIIAEKNIF